MPHPQDLKRSTRLSLWENGPRHAEELSKCPVAPGGLRRITEAMASDHDRLDALEAEAYSTLEAGDLEATRRCYETFFHGLNRHIQIEEELLFPVFELKAGLPSRGPTSILRSEHREIRMLIEELSRNIEGGEGAVSDLRRALHEILKDHHRKEEMVLYPGTDHLLTEVESDALVARLQAFPG
jgi:hemerythrin-like domain-containing protein